MADANRNPLKDLVVGLGAMAEMAHTFYSSMIKSGASPQEATAAMSAFINAFWRDSMESARQKDKGSQEEQDESEP